MKLIEIQELSKEELTEQIVKSRLELVNLRMKFASRQLEDPSQIKKKRKEITRLLTVETQKFGDGKLPDHKQQEEDIIQEDKKTKKKEKKVKVKKEEVKLVEPEEKDKKEITQEIEKPEKVKKVKEEKSILKKIFGKKEKKGKENA